jgi:hypothetical protein
LDALIAPSCHAASRTGEALTNLYRQYQYSRGAPVFGTPVLTVLSSPGVTSGAGPLGGAVVLGASIVSTVSTVLGVLVVVVVVVVVAVVLGVLASAAPSAMGTDVRLVTPGRAA